MSRGSFESICVCFNPMNQALNSVAARSQVRELQAKSTPTTAFVEGPESRRSPRRANGLSTTSESDREFSCCAALENAASATNHVADLPNASAVPEIRSTDGMSSAQIANNALLAVLDQLAMATNKLKQSQSVETSRDLCQLIRDCADAALILKRLLNASSS
jgi:hypothetical protein